MSSQTSSRPAGHRRRSSKSTGGSSGTLSSSSNTTNNNNNTSTNSNTTTTKMMMVETESALPRVFNLQKYQVVLGRYNRCTKTKALTPAVKLYKRVRDQLERGENQSQLPQIKQRIGKLLQEELGYPEPPPVTFWVDVHKAEKDGKLNRFMEMNPQLRRCKDHDGEEVVFVQDHDDYFLKADLAGHKKRRNKCSTSNSNSNNEKTGGKPTKKTKQTKSLKAIMEDHKNRKESYAMRDASSTRRSSVTSATTRTVSTYGSGSVITSTSNNSTANISRVSSDSRSSAVLSNHDSSVISSSSTTAMSTYTSTTTGAALLLFQLTPGGWLDDEVDRISCEWILQDGPTSSLDIITRKTNLVQTFKSYVAYFRRLLQRNDPCKSSPDVALQQMNEGLLVQVVNVLGNSMVDWYNKYPSTCLPGEANAWNDELGEIEESPGLAAAAVAVATASSDNDSMKASSIGTYEVSSEEDKELQDASRRLSEFDISGGGAADCWTIPSSIGNNIEHDDGEEDVTQEDEFDEDDDDDEEEFSQTASSEEEEASPNEQQVLREWSPFDGNNNEAESSMTAAAAPSKPSNGVGGEVPVAAGGDFLLDNHAVFESNNNKTTAAAATTTKKGSSNNNRSSRVRGWAKRPSLSKYSRVKSPSTEFDDDEE